jgi:MraZ protein
VLFVGTHERQLDDKGRLALPAPFRSHLGEHCYVAIGQDKCLNVIPADQFESMAEQLMGRVERGEMSMQRQRAVSSSASLVTIDKQGRVSIDDRLREYAQLTTESRVVVTGNFTTIEIWSPDRFERVRELGTSDLAGDDDL